MAIEQEKTKDFLPVGENLRAMISQSFLTAKNLKDVLNDKGIFIDENDKNKSIPLLMTSILSPKEFEGLVENQITKEEKFKVNTLTIPCKTDKKLLELIPTNFSINNIIKENVVYKPNFKVIGNPKFTIVANNPNQIQLVYEIERKNETKDWVQTKTTHKSFLTIEKKNNEINLVVTKNSTSKETNDINEMIMKSFKTHLKEINLVKEEADYVRILFKNFNNVNRIQFLYSFTSPSISRSLEFIETIKTPNKIKEFISGIDNLKINGKELQEHIFITNETFHEKIIFSSISLKYKFNFGGLKGTCISEFSFPAFLQKQKTNSEFQFNLSINLDKSVKEFGNLNSINKDISRIIENYKLEQFEKYKLTDELTLLPTAIELAGI
jgi:hypothetical protein